MVGTRSEWEVEEWYDWDGPRNLSRWRVTQWPSSFSWKVHENGTLLTTLCGDSAALLAQRYIIGKGCRLKTFLSDEPFDSWGNFSSKCVFTAKIYYFIRSGLRNSLSNWCLTQSKTVNCQLDFEHDANEFAKQKCLLAWTKRTHVLCNNNDK